LAGALFLTAGEPQTVWRSAAWLALAGVLVAALAMAWSWSLKKQVRQRTEALRRATDSVRESEHFLATILEAMPLALFGKEPGGRFRYWLWNAKAEETFGLRREQVLGRSDDEIFPRELAERLRAADEALLARGGSVEQTEERLASRTQGTLYVTTLMTSILSVDGQPYMLLGIAQNFTAQRTMEEAVRQTQKLESLGVLAGGIAHDFNNLLSAIGGNLELARMNLAPQPAASPFLDRIEKILRRASQLTQQMLAYSGKGHLVVKPLELNHVAEEMPHLLEVSISKRVALVYDLCPGLPLIAADAAQIQQVIMNLVTNASEAIGDRDGTITLRTGTQFLADPSTVLDSRGWPLDPGLYVTLEVGDTGCGMGEGTLRRLFDPFFTTKFSGRGLGLSAMLGILRGHRAGIRIQSVPGQGSTFTLYFPADAAQVAPAPVAERDPAPGSGAGTLLVVDDEADILDATAELLEALGYTALRACDGQEALDLFRQDPAGIDLVLMDLTMPRMDGREALAAMRALDPAVKIILCSGFNEADVTKQIPYDSLAGFLQKPYSFQAMKDMLQEALAPGRGSAPMETPPFVG
jgi:PAS domain S-box-containing protein